MSYIQQQFAQFFQQLFQAQGYVIQDDFIVLENCTIPSDIEITQEVKFLDARGRERIQHPKIPVVAGTFVEQISIQMPELKFETAQGDQLGTYRFDQ